MFILGILFSATARAVEIIPIGILTVSPFNVNAFATQVAYYKGAVYTVNVEEGEGGTPRINLRTVVRKATPKRDGAGWNWESRVVDDATLEDEYHTQPSIAVDRKGYLHVAYNMHNMPWQYSVSTRPGDISEFEFRGEKIGLTDKAAVGILNRTSFPGLGTAAIPGQQITYPAFFRDRNGELYVTYRFVTRPARSFADRGQALGIARYDAETRTWSALGGSVPVTAEDAELPPGVARGEAKAFARNDGWWPYSLRLAFDPSNALHALWLWRDLRKTDPRPWVRPMYAVSRDGGKRFATAAGRLLPLPADAESAALVGGFAPGQQFNTESWLTADGPDSVALVLGPLPQGRQLIRLDPAAAGWVHGEASPYAASVVEYDADGRLWAFGNGPTFAYRLRGKVWREVYRDGPTGDFGNAKVWQDLRERVFAVQVSSTDNRRVKLFLVRY